MPLLRNLLFSAARRIASNPEVQAKASEAYEASVKPRLSAAREELQELTRDADPLKNPGDFARRVRDRFREVNKRD